MWGLPLIFTRIFCSSLLPCVVRVLCACLRDAHPISDGCVRTQCRRALASAGQRAGNIRRLPSRQHHCSHEHCINWSRHVLPRTDTRAHILNTTKVDQPSSCRRVMMLSSPIVQQHTSAQRRHHRCPTHCRGGAAHHQPTTAHTHTTTRRSGWAATSFDFTWTRRVVITLAKP